MNATTYDIAERIARVARAEEEREEAEARAAAEKVRIKRESDAQVLMAALREALPSEMVEALDPRVVFPEGESRVLLGGTARITFDFEGGEVTLYPYRDHPADAMWKVIGTVSEGTRSHAQSVYEGRAAHDTLEHDLLLYLGELRAKREERAAHLAEDQEFARRAAEERRLAELKDEDDRAVARIEHERCLALIEERLVAARSAAWTWPAGGVATIYRAVWCVSPPGVADDGEAVAAETAMGYTLQGGIGDAGWVHLREQRGVAERHVRLIPCAHLPVLTELVLRSLEDVPGELRCALTLPMPQMVEVWDNHFPGGRRYAWAGENVYGQQVHLPVGEVPYPWVQGEVR